MSGRDGGERGTLPQNSKPKQLVKLRGSNRCNIRESTYIEYCIEYKKTHMYTAECRFCKLPYENTTFLSELRTKLGLQDDQGCCFGCARAFVDKGNPAFCTSCKVQCAWTTGTAYGAKSADSLNQAQTAQARCCFCAESRLHCGPPTRCGICFVIQEVCFVVGRTFSV